MICRKKRLQLEMTSNHVENRRSKRIKLTDEIRSKRENVEYVKRHDSTRTCEEKSFDRSLTKMFYEISSSFIVEDFVVSLMREDSFCYFTTFVDFFVFCLFRRTCQFEILFLSARVSRRAIKNWKLIVISWIVFDCLFID